MKATDQYFPVVLFIMYYYTLHVCWKKVVVTFKSVEEILKYDHSNESHWAVLSCGAVYYAVQGGSNFWLCGRNPKVWLGHTLGFLPQTQMKASSEVPFLMHYKVVSLLYNFVNENLNIHMKADHNFTILLKIVKIHTFPFTLCMGSTTTATALSDRASKLCTK